MPFSRPTFNELVDRIQNDFMSRLTLQTPILRRSMVWVFARVYAAAVHMLYAALQFLADQIFPDVSESDYLERQAALYGISRVAATFAAGVVDVTGTNGVIIPEGTILQRADGTQYTVDADGTIAGGTVALDVTCSTAGEIGNTDAAVLFTFESPIAGASATGAVDTGIIGGLDTETDESLRTRLLERLQEPPMGGADSDYVQWALGVAGVTRVWVYPLELGPGTVTVRFVRDDDVSMIPDAGEVAAVQAYIDDRRPVTAAVTVVAPVAAPIAFTIDLTPDTAATRAAVTAELEDLITRDGEPGGTILLSRIREAVSIAAGESDNIVTVPAANVTNTTGNIPTMGVITWV